MNIFFTADQHFGHTNIIKHCNRPFQNVEEMDAYFLDNWNSTVKPKDVVYFLGDLSFHPEKYLPKLNGRIHFILGNHDRQSVYYYAKQPNVESVSHIKEIKLDKHFIVLCHYPLVSWNRSCHGSWHLHGHSHGKYHPQKLSFDVGVDSTNYKLCSWEFIEDMLDHFSLLFKLKENQ